MRQYAPLLVTLVALTIACAPGQDVSQSADTGLSRAAIADGVRAAQLAANEQHALAALDAYMETWNTRMPAVWATSLHFPHVRPSAGPFEMTFSPEEYEETVDFERVLATGWHRTQWDSRRVLHVGEDKVHIAGQYTRYTREGEPITTALVTYIVTEQDGHWGTQARFGTGNPDLTVAERSENASAADAAIRSYFHALNSFDPDTWAATMHYPQVRVAGGTAQLWATAEELKAGTEPGRMRTWFRTRVDAIEPVQVAANGVNASVRYSMENPEGEVLSTRDAVFLVTQRDGEWKVQARSTIAP